MFRLFRYAIIHRILYCICWSLFYEWGYRCWIIACDRLLWLLKLTFVIAMIYHLLLSPVKVGKITQENRRHLQNDLWLLCCYCFFLFFLSRNFSWCLCSGMKPHLFTMAHKAYVQWDVCANKNKREIRTHGRAPEQAVYHSSLVVLFLLSRCSTEC